MPPGPFRVLIVDDELAARRKVRRVVEQDPELHVVGEAGTASAAINSVREGRPDVVFLDVRMPGPDGMAVARELAEHPEVLVVFVTAYDEFAVRAFEVRATDYVLKPFDAPRLREAIARAKARLRERATLTAVASLHEALHEAIAGAGGGPRDATGPECRHPDRILVKDGARAFFVPTPAIDWIEAAGSGVLVHTADGAHRVRHSLAALAALLDPTRFVRIHRGALVNLERVREIAATEHGDYRLRLRDGTELRLSRRYRQNIAGLA
jgi:two-component system, LytTR family, response regulator